MVRNRQMDRQTDRWMEKVTLEVGAPPKTWWPKFGTNEPKSTTK